MTQFEIVPATAIDQKAIRQLVRQVGINPTGLKWRNFLVVKDENGRLLGSGQLKPQRDGSIELASIAVDASYRQQGLARQIIEALLTRQVSPIWLKCEVVSIECLKTGLRSGKVKGPTYLFASDAYSKFVTEIFHSTIKREFLSGIIMLLVVKGRCRGKPLRGNTQMCSTLHRCDHFRQRSAGT